MTMSEFIGLTGILLPVAVICYEDFKVKRHNKKVRNDKAKKSVL